MARSATAPWAFAATRSHGSGRRSDLPRDVGASRLVECGGAWLTPGLIDCHTHLVYAGNRAHEFERRLHGATYADIAREGGGIAATVRATRAASEAELRRRAGRASRRLRPKA